MKICPKCSFSNEECFPICVWCNAPIVNVASTPATDPNHPEHEQKAFREKRHALLSREIRLSAVLYSLAIALTAVIPGMVLAPHVLILYLATALIVAFAVFRHFVGQLTASLLQAVFSLVLLVFFGPLQPLIFYMLGIHIILATAFWHWSALIYDAHR